MGCGGSSAKPETAEPSDAPKTAPAASNGGGEKKPDAKKPAAGGNKKEVRMVLLGPGESGKSTFFKQLKILQEGENRGWTESELRGWTSAIYSNLRTQMQILVKTHTEQEMEYSDESVKEVANKFLDQSNTEVAWKPELGQWIKTLWNEPSIKAIYNERDRLFTLNDGAGFLFDAIDRINEPNYVPNAQDLLRVRIRSAGIEKAEYSFKDTTFKVYDVGGQIPERRKWAKLLRICTAIIFFASLSEYDQKLREDESKWRLADTLSLWEEIMKVPELAGKPTILMLNKVDIFKQKVQKKGIDCFFPEYKGPAGDWEAAADYIKKQYLNRLGGSKEQINVLVHFICAVDTTHVERIWGSLRELLLKKALVQAMDMMA